jgi:hypothetical protein
MKMKYLSLTLLVIISLNCFTAQTPATAAKDFLTGFSNHSTKNFSIDACMSEGSITISLNHLLEDLRARKIKEVIEDFQNLIYTINKNCPVETVKNYINAKKAAIEGGYYFKNLQQNNLKAANIVIMELNNKQRSAYSIGVACAEIEKLLVYKQIKNLRVLASPKLNMKDILPNLPDFNIDLEGFKKFFYGVLKGVSSVPFDKNICYKSALDLQIDDIFPVFRKLVKSIKKRSIKEFFNFLRQVFNILKTLYNANTNCNIKRLIKKVKVYANPIVGFTKLIWNITKNYSVYYDDIKCAYKDLKNKDWRRSGYDIGRITSNLLKWKTS